TTIEQANQFLKEYIGIFNKQFGVPACDSYSMFVPTPKTLDLDNCVIRYYAQTFKRIYHLNQKPFVKLSRINSAQAQW
ncbi:hypothetical protein, partial [Treponema phagedenis]|uniref:hypothetical protein n=1 Tax=Treponema phagedenis TaxID=162 RepID=UPI001E637172